MPKIVVPSVYSDDTRLEIEDYVIWRAKIVWQTENSTDEVRAAEYRSCKNSFLYWLDRWGWLCDPRHNDMGLPFDVPFIAFEYQRQIVPYLLKPIDQHIEKSRAMGATWFLMAFITWITSFHNNIMVKVFSKKEQDVEDGTLDSLMGKARYLHDRMPGWMQSGYRSTRKPIKMVFDKRDNSWVMGESANDGIGRL